MLNKIRSLISKVLILFGMISRKFGDKLINFGRFLLNKETNQKTQINEWRRVLGDKTLRLNYNLDDKSIVFDLGGYEGQWSSDIYSRYRCKIFCFEILGNYALNIKNRFANNYDICVFPFGLSSVTKKIDVYINNDGTTIYPNKYDDVDVEIGEVVNFLDFIKEHNVDHIDLMKVNIEGAEYDLLEYLIEQEYIKKIYNIQVQFHKFVPDAQARMRKIQSALQSTHQLTYQYEFVWENWEIK